MEFVDSMTNRSSGTQRVRSYTSQSLESFHRTSERLLFECIHSITDLIHRQIERFSRQSELLSSDSSAEGRSRSRFSISPEVRSSMRTLSADAWSIFKSLTSLIKERAFTSRSASQDAQAIQSSQIDGDELQQQLERLLSRVHELETSHQSGLNVQDSSNGFNNGELGDYPERLREKSKSQYGGSSCEQIEENQTGPEENHSLEEVTEFIGEKNALQNMARVLTELDSLVKNLDESRECSDREQSYDGEWSEKVLPPKKGRHLLGNTATNPDNGLDWVDGGRLSSASNDSRATQFSIRSGEGRDWDHWKSKLGETISPGNWFARYNREEHQRELLPNNFDDSGIGTLNVSNGEYQRVASAQISDIQKRSLVGVYSTDTDEGYRTGQCRPSLESEPQNLIKCEPTQFSKSSELDDCRDGLDRTSVESISDPWEIAIMSASGNADSSDISLKTNFSTKSNRSTKSLGTDKGNEGETKKTRSKLHNVSSDESRFSWLPSITLNPEEITQESPSIDGKDNVSGSYWRKNHASLGNVSLANSDFADLYNYDKAHYIDSTSSDEGSSKAQFGKTETEPNTDYSSKETDFKDPFENNEFTMENYIGATSNNSILLEIPSSSSRKSSSEKVAQSVKPNNSFVSINPSLFRSCLEQVISRESSKAGHTIDPSQIQSDISCLTSDSENKPLKQVDGFMSFINSADLQYDTTISRNLLAVDFYNKAVQLLNDIVAKQKNNPSVSSKNGSSVMRGDVSTSDQHGSQSESQSSFAHSNNMTREKAGSVSQRSKASISGTKYKMSIKDLSKTECQSCQSRDRYSSRVDMSRLDKKEENNPDGTQSRSSNSSFKSRPSNSSTRSRKHKSKRESVPFGNSSKGTAKTSSRASCRSAHTTDEIQPLECNCTMNEKNRYKDSNEIRSYSSRTEDNALPCVDDETLAEILEATLNESLGGMDVPYNASEIVSICGSNVIDYRENNTPNHDDTAFDQSRPDLAKSSVSSIRTRSVKSAPSKELVEDVRFSHSNDLNDPDVSRGNSYGSCENGSFPGMDVPYNASQIVSICGSNVIDYDGNKTHNDPTIFDQGHSASMESSIRSARTHSVKSCLPKESCDNITCSSSCVSKGSAVRSMTGATSYDSRENQSFVGSDVPYNASQIVSICGSNLIDYGDETQNDPTIFDPTRPALVESATSSARNWSVKSPAPEELAEDAMFSSSAVSKGSVVTSTFGANSYRHDSCGSSKFKLEPKETASTTSKAFQYTKTGQNQTMTPEILSQNTVGTSENQSQKPILTPDNMSTISRNGFQFDDKDGWGRFPTASRSCPSFITPPASKHNQRPMCLNSSSAEISWKKNVAIIFGYAFAFFVLFSVLCTAIETHRRTFEGCALMILDDLYKHLEVHYEGPAFV